MINTYPQIWIGGTRMTNFYVTYSFSDENTRRKFYEEVKAEKIGEKTRLEDGCIRYAFFFDADREDRMFLWEQWEAETLRRNICSSRTLRRFQS